MPWTCSRLTPRSMSSRAVDARKLQVIELRFFGGLTVEETARILQVAPDTVARDWRFARAWLKKQLQTPFSN